MSFSKVPSVYPDLLKLRTSKTAVLKIDKYWNKDMSLRYYQVIGAAHMILLNRMILGDGVGLGKCVCRGTYVSTSSGLRRIEELFPSILLEDNFYPIYNVSVLTLNGVLPVDNIYYNGRGTGIRIITESGFENCGTPVHPVLCEGINGMEYRKLSDIMIGNRIPINRGGVFSSNLFDVPYQKQFIDRSFPKYLNEDIAEFIGFRISDTSIRRDLYFSECGELVFQNPEMEERLQSYLRKYFGYYGHFSNILDKAVIDFFECLGLILNNTNDSNKVVPRSILGSPKSVVRSFLRGYLEKNGKIESNGSIRLSIYSEEFSRQIQLLFLQFGLVFRRVKMIDFWSLSLSPDFSDLFMLEIGFISVHKSMLYHTYTLVSPHTSMPVNGLFLDTVKSIQYEYNEFFDLSVPVEHNFTANGFINHNTVQTIAAYAYLLDKNPLLKLLIICPKSAMCQWKEEIEKFTSGISSHIISSEYNNLSGQEARKLQYETVKTNVMILNYSIVLREYEFIKKALLPDYMVVADEVHMLKSRKGKTNFACCEIMQDAGRVYGLSATIIKNGLEEVYGIYKAIVPGLFGNITSFKDAFCQEQMMKLRIGGKIRKIPKIVGYKNLKEFKALIDPYFLIRKKEDVATELPKLISRRILLDMGPEQRDLYRQALNGILYEERVKNEFFEIADKIRTSDFDEKLMNLYNERKEKYEKYMTEDGKKRGRLAALTYCQMISDGPGLLKEPGESSKEEEFQRLVTEELQNEKIIVFTRFKSAINFLEIICERNHIQYDKITGDVLTAEDRRKAQMRFQNDPNCRILFITTAGSASLNLQAAGVIIFYDTPWSYGDLAQTIGRAQRIGSLQEHILLIHLINRKTIDERVIKKVSEKKVLSDSIIGDTSEGALNFMVAEDNIINDLFEGILEDAESI